MKRTGRRRGGDGVAVSSSSPSQQGRVSLSVRPSRPAGKIDRDKQCVFDIITSRPRVYIMCYVTTRSPVLTLGEKSKKKKKMRKPKSPARVERSPSGEIFSILLYLHTASRKYKVFFFFFEKGSEPRVLTSVRSELPLCSDGDFRGVLLFRI